MAQCSRALNPSRGCEGLWAVRAEAGHADSSSHRAACGRVRRMSYPGVRSDLIGSGPGRLSSGATTSRAIWADRSWTMGCRWPGRMGYPCRVDMPAKPQGTPRLLPLVRAAMRLRRLSLRTEETYLAWILRYIRHHGTRHPETMGEAEVLEFLNWLVVDRRVAHSTQMQALSALLFLYRDVLRNPLGDLRGLIRARGPVRLPVVLSAEEVGAILAQLRGGVWLVAALLYGSGLRLSEALGLRVKDLDFGRREIVVRRGKGGKDRVTMLPESLGVPLQRHLKRVREMHQRDLARGTAQSSCPTRSSARSPRRQRGGPGNGPFPRCEGTSTRRRGSAGAGTCIPPWSSAQSPRRCVARGSGSGPAVTPSGTHLPPIPSRGAMTSGRCRSCSGTRT